MLTPRFGPSLSLLLQASQYIKELVCEHWDFAVEIDLLRQGGLTHSDIRWLLVKGYLIQALEVIPPPRGQRRAFTPCPTLTLDERSCFLLTTEGIALAQSLEGVSARADPLPLPRPKSNGFPIPSHGPEHSQKEAGTPCWDKDRRTLRFRNQVVKRFKVPAPNQELILAVFQEEEWPSHIDDPLPRANLIEPKRRLHDTINSLNRNQSMPLLRFLGDGNGLGLCWEPLAEA